MCDAAAVPPAVETLQGEFDCAVDALARNFHRKVVEELKCSPSRATELLWELGLTTGRYSRRVAENVRGII